MKPLSRTQQQTRRCLMDALLGILPHKPLDRIGVREVTDAAGYNRSTFYLYFTDIYDLADAVERELIETLSNEVRQILDKAPQAPLTERVEDIVFFVAPHLETLNLCAGLPGFLDAFQKTIAPLFSHVTGINEKDSRFDYLLSFITTVMLHNVRYLTTHPDGISLPEMIGLMQQIILPGIEHLTDPPRRSLL